MQKIIKRIKFFFEVLTKSLTKFSYYKEISKAKFTFSLKYLFFLFYLIALLGSLVLSLSMAALILPKVPTFINAFKTEANSVYPSGLTVTVKNGLLSTNQKEPYYIDSLNKFGIVKGFSHFITIDTKADPSNIKNEDTAVLVTKDSVVTIDNNNSYQVYPIDTKTNATIDQKSYEKIISQIDPYLKYIEPGLVALIVLLILIWPIVQAGFSILGQLVYLLIFTLLFFLVTKIIKKEIPFKKLYQLAMHASTLPIILGFVVSSLGLQMPFLIDTAILFIFMVLVVNQF